MLDTGPSYRYQIAIHHVHNARTPPIQCKTVYILRIAHMIHTSAYRSVAMRRTKQMSRSVLCIRTFTSHVLPVSDQNAQCFLVDTVLPLIHRLDDTWSTTASGRVQGKHRVVFAMEHDVTLIAHASYLAGRLIFFFGQHAIAQTFSRSARSSDEAVGRCSLHLSACSCLHYSCRSRRLERAPRGLLYQKLN